MKKRIAILGTRSPYYPGGIEKYVLSLLKDLSGQVNVSWFIPSSTSRPYVPNVRFVHVPCIPHKYLEKLTYALSLLPYLFFRRFDIYHFQSINSTWLIPLLWILRCRIIVTIHSFDWTYPRWRFPAKVFLLYNYFCALIFADVVITVPGQVLPFRKLRLSKTVVFFPHPKRYLNIDQGLSPESLESHHSFSELPTDYFLFIGRITPEKNLHSLCQALHEAKLNIPLFVVGKLADKNYFNRHKHHMISPDIHYLGQIDDDSLLAHFITRSRLVICPSFNEYVPYVGYEALSCKANICLSDIPPHMRYSLPRHHYFSPHNISELISILTISSVNPDFFRPPTSYIQDHFDEPSVVANLHYSLYTQ